MIVHADGFLALSSLLRLSGTPLNSVMFELYMDKVPKTAEKYVIIISGERARDTPQADCTSLR